MHPSSWKWQVRCLSTKTRRPKSRQIKKLKKKVDLAEELIGQGEHSSSWSKGWGRGKEGPLGNSPQAGSQDSDPLKKNQCAFCHPEVHLRSEGPQLQPRHKETKEKGLYGAHRHWVGRLLELTGIFRPWPLRAHDPYVSRGLTCRFHGGHWH
jgi:hypothetical protein